MMGDLDGKVAVATGAGSGIGRAAALALASLGARIVVADVDLVGGEETAARIRSDGGEAHMVSTDVSRAEDVRSMVDRTIEIYGRLDCAVNNAGIETASAFTADCSEENWDRTLTINLKGVWLCMKAQIPHMLTMGGGSIVNVSSVFGLVGCPGGVAYAASKHAINGITRTAALEYAARGIRVNAVCPGGIHTAMIDRLNERNPDYIDRLIGAEPIGRLASPDEVGKAIAWLCSSASSFITGAVIPVDGGWTAR